ncbi:hypothetical protein H257_12992 [Aphanomyces astaci]|uniref:DDE Tnp4 domain-containing protein n=1 Tax=Aphanomyces astaci TaxID=112090 RepID=W4FYI4_APHAT|nr:hypothetical protein H257_12992 [Aphanomyces astaci]ETV71859.1 hypothetical protein H257_12992 [Aphanomyces astaci]|eukprot:XP_009838708.1 hypothetical protein H257_12992 [Aphanomyces astaci]
MLFMTLTSLKHCGSWDVVSALFDDTSASFSNRVNSFLKTLHPFLVGRYIDAVADKYTMEHLETNKRRFANYPCALYAVDVTFQKTNIPARSFPERKRFFSKKHGQHGVKVEASVLPNGLAINVTNAVPASMADIAIAQSNREFHLNKLAKTPSELDMADQGPLREEYPASWAILADKGYQGLHRNLRAITPTKRPAGGVLTVSEMDVNDKIASDRVIIEKIFGRLKTLWSVVGDTLKWKRDNYDIYFQSYVAFTNVHIRFMPLRAEDGHDLHRLVNGLISTGQKKKAKRAGSVAMSRDKRKRRLSAMYANGETFQLSAEMEYDESEDGSCIFD